MRRSGSGQGNKESLGEKSWRGDEKRLAVAASRAGSGPAELMLKRSIYNFARQQEEGREWGEGDRE